MTCQCDCHHMQSLCCDDCHPLRVLERDVAELKRRMTAIEDSPMMQLKARCNRCGKEVNPAMPDHLCLVPGGVIVNA